MYFVSGNERTHSEVDPRSKVEASFVGKNFIDCRKGIFVLFKDINELVKG